MNKLFITSPTLEELISSSSNSKELASIANMEYSNFRKHCNGNSNISFETYLRCAASFDLDVIIFHVPKGLVDTLLTSVPHRSNRYSTINKEDIIFIINSFCEIDLEHLSQLLLKKGFQRIETQELGVILPKIIEVLRVLIHILEEHGDG